MFAVLPSFETALANIGVGADGIATTPLSGQPDLFGGVNAEFDALAQASVEDIYGRFTGLVAASRRLPVARVNEIAEGRVWAGATARQLGLVDQFGGLDVAIQEAAKLARLDPTKVYGHVFEAQPDAFSAFFADMGAPGEDEEAAPPSGWFAQAAWLRDVKLSIC